MIQGYLRDIEDLEYRLERAERRGMDGLVARLRDDLSTARSEFLRELVRRKESHEDDTFAQRARRRDYDELIEEQQAILKDDTHSDSRKVIMTDGYTTIQVRESTRDRLFSRKSPDVTYEDVVVDLLDRTERKVDA